MDVDELVKAAKRLEDVESLVETLVKTVQRLEDMHDTRTSSIKIGTGTRHEAKVYFDPAKPKEAAQMVKTAVDMLDYGQDLLENGTVE